MRVLVSRVRQALATAGLRAELRSHPMGYELLTGPDDLDALEVVSGFEQARAIPDAARREQRLDELLARWRGPVVADLPELAMHPGVGGLDRLYDELLDEWAAAALDVGLHTAVEHRLWVGADTEPATERLLGHLLTAMYRSGRQVEALARYRAHADQLRDRLGVEPSPELQAVELAILSHDRDALGDVDHAEGDYEQRLTVMDGQLRSTLADGPERRALERRAAADALESRSFDLAARHFESALGAGALEDPERLELLVALGDARRRAAHPGHREPFAEAAALVDRNGSVDDLVKVASHLREVGWHGVCGDGDDFAIQLHERALDALPCGDARRARLAADLAGALLHTPGEARCASLYAEGLATARATCNPAIVRSVLANAMVLDDSNDLDARLGAARELVESALADGDLEAEHFGHRIALWANLETGDGAAMESHWLAVARTAEQLRQPAYQWAALTWSATVELHLGRVAAAEERAQRAYVFGSEHGIETSRVVAMFGGQIAELRHLQDRLGELAAVAATMVDDDAERDHQPYVQWRTAYPLFLAHAGDLDGARDRFDDVLRRRLPFERGVGWSSEALCAIETAVLLDDRAAARAVYDAVVDRADRFVSTGVNGAGPLAIPLGRAAELDGNRAAALGHFDDAATSARAGRAPLYAALADAYRARLLAQSTDPDEVAQAALLAARAARVGRERKALLVERVAGLDGRD